MPGKTNKKQVVHTKVITKTVDRSAIVVTALHAASAVLLFAAFHPLLAIPNIVLGASMAKKIPAQRARMVTTAWNGEGDPPEDVRIRYAI